MRTTHTLVTLLPIYLAKFSKMLVKTLQTRTSEQAARGCVWGQALEREGRGAEVQGRERERPTPHGRPPHCRRPRSPRAHAPPTPAHTPPLAPIPPPLSGWPPRGVGGGGSGWRRLAQRPPHGTALLPVALVRDPGPFPQTPPRGLAAPRPSASFTRSLGTRCALAFIRSSLGAAKCPISGHGPVTAAAGLLSSLNKMPPSPVPCPLPTPTPSLARAPGSQLQKNLRPAPRPEHPFSPPVGTPVECPSMPGSSRGLRPRRGSTPGARAHVSRHAWPRRCVRGPLSWDQSPRRQHSRGRRLGHREPVLLVYPASRSPHLFAEPPKVGPGWHHGHSLRCLSLEAAASRTPPRVPGRGSVAVEGPHPDRVPHGSGRLEFSFGLAHETGAGPLGPPSPAQGPSSEKLQPRTRPATPHRCGARWPPCP